MISNSNATTITMQKHPASTGRSLRKLDKMPIIFCLRIYTIPTLIIEYANNRLEENPKNRH